MKWSIFTLNCWLLPLNLSKHSKQRLDMICSFITRRQPDIVALQEIFQKKRVRELEKRLARFYFIHHFSGRRFNRSGLVLLSKQKPDRVEFIAFPRHKSYPNDIINKLGKRGILITEFNNSIVYNTHLYVRPGTPNIQITLNELEFLKGKIDKKKLSIICGDLNLTTGQFNSANKSFFSYGENESNTFSLHNPYLRKWWDPKVKGDKKIDYILIKNSNNFKFSYINHYGNDATPGNNPS